MVNAARNIEEGTRLTTLSMVESDGARKVLDVGSGNGEFTQMIIEHLNNNSEVVGMDGNINFVKMALDKYRHKTILADANKIFPFSDDSFDLVIASQIIEHVYDTDLFIKEVYRILKKGGYCVCSTPNLASVHNIISLMLGNQPFTCHTSDATDFGTLCAPLHPEWSESQWIGMKHRRIFTAKALKGLFEYYGFKCEEIKGFGYYFMPVIIQRLIKSPKYSAYMSIKVRK
jgi:ubiquinone/menaquinone biosynthesis C-methylase UbiE